MHASPRTPNPYQKAPISKYFFFIIHGGLLINKGCRTHKELCSDTSRVITTGELQSSLRFHLAPVLIAVKEPLG